MNPYNSIICCTEVKHHADTLQVDVGVPQGSVLGGLLVGDLPEAIHDHETQDENKNECSFNIHCEEFGGLGGLNLPGVLLNPRRSLKQAN